MINAENSRILLETYLNKIEELRSQNINEANTRLQIIDDILILLGWQKSEFSPAFRFLVVLLMSGLSLDGMIPASRAHLNTHEAKQGRHLRR